MANFAMGEHVSQLRTAFHQLQDWAYPDEMTRGLFRAFNENAARRRRVTGRSGGFRGERGGIVGARHVCDARGPRLAGHLDIGGAQKTR